jgi:hypothetical protein
MPPVGVRCLSFRLPRRGYSAEECDDALACDPEKGRFAVADGAAESAQSGLWARLLVEAFASGEGLPAWPGWVAGVQARWASLASPEPEAPVPWYLEGRHRQGAFATFLGVALDGPSWLAVAVGDSCLFHVRNGRLEAAFPLERSSQFDNAPWLIGSRTDPDKVPLERGAVLGGEARPGDRLWLMTDALARWFLQEREAGGRPWVELEGLADAPEGAFAAWVEGQREVRKLRNDDTTLVGVLL